MISEAQVRAALNTIIDPCSVAAGAPAGLQDMGLVRHVTIGSLSDGQAGGRAKVSVQVVIGVTEFGCLMGAPFAMEAQACLARLVDVDQVDVQLDGTFDWLPQDMDPAYRARLHSHRQQRANSVQPIRIQRA